MKLSSRSFVKRSRGLMAPMPMSTNAPGRGLGQGLDRLCNTLMVVRRTKFS
jgi:hypothetical protein